MTRDHGRRDAAVPWVARPAEAAVEALLLDLDGVVYTGGRILPGAVAAATTVRDGGGVVRFVTNNAFRTPAQVAGRLVELGVAATAEEVVTSAVVAVDLVSERLRGQDAVVAVVGGPGITEPLAAAGLDGQAAATVAAGAAAALIQGFSPHVAWPDLAAAARHARAGTWWVATNLDPTLPTEDGPAPGNGSLVRAVATAAGREPDVVAGKPDPVMVVRAMPPSLRGAPERALMVGDRLDTDVAAARAAAATAMLVLSGTHGPTDLLAAPPSRRPHLLGHDLRDVSADHPGVILIGEGVAQCRGTVARVSLIGDGAAVTVEGDPRDCPLDAVRALCSATWSVVDALPAADRCAAVSAVIDAVRAGGAVPVDGTHADNGCGQAGAALSGGGSAG